MFTQGSFAAMAFGLIASVNGHSIMNTPVPYQYDTVSTSPLDGSSLQFPCQLGTSGSYQAYNGQTTAITAGSSTLVNFTGSAVHGGGSCQFSVTYDDPPSADPSKWKVIHSIVGGCPAQAAGNVETVGSDQFGRPDGPHCGDSTGTECVREFNIPIPKQLKNGKAIFAWTWFNNIGNAEMYMNCAPITISGGSNDDTYTNSLPDVFVANVPGHCSTNSAADGVLGFPDPGTSVERNDSPASDIQGSCPAADSGSSSGGSSAGGSSTPAATPTSTPSYGGASTPAPVASTPQASYSASAPGVFAPGASSAPAASGATPATSVAASSPVASAPAGTGAAGSTTNPNCTFKCSNPGNVVCIGSSQWGLCTTQMCATPMDLAAGTSCQNGVVAKRSEHLRRHHARHFAHNYS